MVAATGLCDFTGRLRIGIALREAILNALFHGNLEISAEQLEQVQDRLIQEKDISLVEERRSLPRYRDRRIFVEMEIAAGGAPLCRARPRGRIRRDRHARPRRSPCPGERARPGPGADADFHG